MRIASIIVVVLVVMASAPVATYAQGTASYDPHIGSVMVSSLGFFESLPEFDLGKISLSARAIVGWKHIGLNYSLNAAHRNFGVLQESPVEIAIRNTYVWSGQVDMGLRISRKLRLFGIAEGNAGSSIPVSTPIEPANANPAEPAVWRGSRLEWWALDGGISYDFGRDFRIVAGLKHDHLQMELRDPVNLAVPGDFAG